MRRLFLAAILISLLSQCSGTDDTVSFVQPDKARIVVVTDLGGQDPEHPAAFDPDDTESMIHLLVCSNAVDIEAIVSGMAWTSEPDRTKYIFDLLDNYAEIYPNLSKHGEGFPTPEYLRSITKKGPSLAHMDAVGEGMDSPGSDFIIEVVDKDDPRPVWLTTWCGSAAIAQALWKVQNTRTPEQVEKFLSKIRIYDVLGQDDAGSWIAKKFPDIPYLRNNKVYGWTPEDTWFKENIQAVKPFGDHYPSRIWSWEGDSPGFYYFLANGLNFPEHREWGGWGGRFTSEKVSGERGMGTRNRDFSKYDPYYMYVSETEGVAAVNLWKEEILNDFAARMQWTATPDYSSVNHHPKAVLDGDASLQPMYFSVKAGSSLKLSAGKSSDPDGNSISYTWTVYPEAGTYEGKVSVTGNTEPKCSISVPSDASGKTIHVILKVTDDGTPALTAYRRAILKVKS